MRKKSIRLVFAAFVAAAALISSGQTTFAQDKTATDKAAPTPIQYTPDGQPDIQGVWRANPGGNTYDVTGIRTRSDAKLQGNGRGLPSNDRVVGGTPEGDIPYQPWAIAKRAKVNVDNPTKPEDVDTQARCLLEGPGRVFIHSGFQILQTPQYVIFFTEQNDETRIVPLNGGPHVGKDIQLWQGDSRGHWEGNTLVIDVTNVKAKSRLDMIGNFYSPAAHFVERLTVVDAKTIEYEATITDPTVYTKPWKLTAHFARRFAANSGYEVYEDACHEGERTADTLAVSGSAQNDQPSPAGKTLSKN
jgi:hypothetical protein